MEFIFDKIIEYKSHCLNENITNVDQKAILDDLNARISSMPASQRGAIIDLLTSLRDNGGMLVPSKMPPKTSGVEATTPAPTTPAGSTQTTPTPEKVPAKQPADVEKEKQAALDQNKKTAENMATQQTIAAANQAAGYAKG